MKRILAALSLVSVLLLCVSWGPITHDSMASDIAGQASDYLNNYRHDGFYAGCIAPDIALAAKPGTWDTRQSLFHSGEFVDAMKYINEHETQNTMRYSHFIAGYEVHLICDGVEGQYGSTKTAPVSLEFAVDKLVGSSGGGNIDAGLLDFMLKAWQRAYPADTSVTASWLSKAEGNFGLYMSGIYNPVSKADAEKYFSDYRAWYDQSVTESVAFLKALNIVPEPTPQPTFTLAPPTFITPTTPVPVIGGRPGNFIMTFARWFFGLFKR